MLWAWNVVFVCNTESIFLCVSTSEAEPPLLRITNLTTGSVRLSVGLKVSVLDAGPSPTRQWALWRHMSAIDMSSLRVRQTWPITRSRRVTPRRCGLSLPVLQQAVDTTTAAATTTTTGAATTTTATTTTATTATTTTTSGMAGILACTWRDDIGRARHTSSHTHRRCRRVSEPSCWQSATDHSSESTATASPSTWYTTTVHLKYCCRMTNYELFRWLVEMPSRDVDHYRMINASRSTVYHYNDTRSRDVY